MFSSTNDYLIKFSEIVLFCLCPLVFFIPRGAVVVLAIVGLLGWISQGLKPLSLLKNPVSITILALIAWAGLSSLWAPIPADSIRLSLRLMAFLLLGVGWASWIQSRSSSDLSVLKRRLFYGIVLALTLIFIDVLLGNPWQQFAEKSSAKAFVPLVLTLSLAIWPCLSLVSGKLKNCLGMAFVIGILLTIDSDTAVVAIVCGAVAYLSYHLLPRFTEKGLNLGTLFLILGLPWLLSGLLTDSFIKDFNQSVRSFSYIHRLYIWQFVSHKITEKSLIGQGGDSSRAALVGGEEKVWSTINKAGEDVPIHSKAISLHPHNLPLQIWLELGAVGAFIMAALSYFLLRGINRYSVKDAAIIVGFFAAASLTFLVNLGCWQSWWLATLVLIMPLLYASPKTPLASSLDI